MKVPDATDEGGHPAPASQNDTVSKRQDQPAHVAQDAAAPQADLPTEPPEEHGGQSGPEPTRYGDWEKKGRCTDF